MRYFFSFISACLIFLCACSPDPGIELDIFHTNDIQGFYWARKSAENDNRPTGGIAVLKNLLSNQENPFMLFDSGNTFSKTQVGKQFKLDGAVNLMNKLGYTAATLSSADLALGWDVVESGLKKANFPIVVSNLENKDGTQPKYIKKYVIAEENGIKAAVLGVMSKQDFPDTLRNSSLLVKDEISAIRELLPQLEKHNPDIIILLSSIGFDLDLSSKKTDEKILAEELPELTVILGGNSDVSGAETEEISKTLVTRCPPMLFETAKIKLKFSKNKQFSSYQFEPVILDKDTLGQDEDLEREIENMRKVALRTTSRKIASLGIALPTYSDRPSPLGAYTAQCIKRWGKNELGIINSDAFLNGFEQGPLSEVQLGNAIPFNDRVMFIKMRGDELKNALEYSIATKNNWPQTAGLRVVYDADAPLGKKIKKLYINGAPMQAARLYSISVSDHIVAGGMGHNEFLNVFEFKNTDRTVRDILRWCLNRDKEVLSVAQDLWKEE
ncbi:bifunctional metallophosphatase/5'-nucleotidase [Candidatus Proelusimicrobium volucris]|uniref:bifunctional metallophosphatase/5'-nucleotidase n=1 Tax=Candidatus Proelusimicrobium volucris TaxID=3416225 RepID=UPI003D12A10E